MSGRTWDEVKRRYHQVTRLWAEEGPRRLGARALDGASRRLASTGTLLEVRPSDVLGADPADPPGWRIPTLAPDERLTVNWVTTPPAAGSGGHTTMFRLVTYLEAQGHTCRLYLYDVYGNDASYHERVVRESFGFAGEIGDAREPMADAHAVVATSWQTAYPAFRDRCAGRRFYLVQDFEPSFYPSGSESTLAENTYRLGFHALTAGPWLATKLAADYGMGADGFEFGCDRDVYRLDDAPRDGIVFYARPEAPRRAFELGIMALELFAAAHPEITIHFFGKKIGRLAFSFVDHGLLSTAELNELYNRCYAGLCLSMTNVSLVPHELLASGCIPVMNDAAHNRIVIDNPYARYAAPEPHALARALGEVVTTPDFPALAAAASASVVGASWDAAGQVVETALRREVVRARGAGEAHP